MSNQELTNALKMVSSPGYGRGRHDEQQLFCRDRKDTKWQSEEIGDASMVSMPGASVACLDAQKKLAAYV